MTGIAGGLGETVACLRSLFATQNTLYSDWWRAGITVFKAFFFFPIGQHFLHTHTHTHHLVPSCLVLVCRANLPSKRDRADEQGRKKKDLTARRKDGMTGVRGI